MKRSFASLNPKEALHVAIFVEQRNATLYEQFAELFDTFNDVESDQISTVFADMAAEEREHGTELHDRYVERYGMAPCTVTDDDVRDVVELPRLDNAQLLAISRGQLGTAPTHKALEIALAAEMAAMRFYGRLVQITDDSDLRKIYAELAEFEDHHVRFIKQKVDEARRSLRRSDA